jgi:outer membrane protein assembly factor BamB
MQHRFVRQLRTVRQPLTLHRCSWLSFITAAVPTRGRNWQLLFFVVAMAAADSGSAQDWPQIMGKNRDGQAQPALQLSTDWPATGKILWQIGLGSGYSGPAVAGQQVLALHRLGNEEVLEALDLDSGKKLWRASWPASYRSSIDADNGPRCVPTVAQDSVICYGAAGDLACVSLSNGQLQWHRALRKEYRADDGYFGAGSAPLVMGNTIIVCLGGKAAGIIGVDLNTGKTKWTATDYDASYTAPIAIDSSTALVVTRLKTVLIDVANGSLLSEIAFGSRGPTVNAATPIALGQNQYMLTANYGVGATLLAIEGRQLLPVFQGSDLISSQYITPVKLGNRVLAIDGRDDGPPSNLRAIDLSAQRIVWEQTGFGTAHLIANANQLLALTKSGNILLIDGQADQYRELAHMQIPPGTYRAPPALSGNKLLARDTNNDTSRSQLLCIELPTVK